MYLIYTLSDGSKAYYRPKSTYIDFEGNEKQIQEYHLWDDFYYRKEFVLADNNVRINKKYIMWVELINE